MGLSYPDWSNVRKPRSYILREDLSELAARLGSIHVYDRRGSVFWMDDFSDGVTAWTATLSGTGAAAASSTVTPKWPPNCYKLTGGSDGGRSVTIVNYFGVVTAGGVGLELSVQFLSDFFDFKVGMDFENEDGVQFAFVKLVSDDDKIYYYNGSGDWVELDDLIKMYHTTSGYHNFKLVVDFDEGTYLRFLLDDASYDLSDYALYTTPTFDNRRLELNVYFRSRSGQNDACNIDGVILTTDEE